MGRQRTKARYNLLVQFHDYSRPVCIAPARSRRRHRAHPRRAVSAPSSAPSIARRRPRSRELLSSSLPSHAIAAAVHLRPVPNKAISLCMSHVTLAVVLVSSTYHTYSASSHELGCALRVPLTYSCILTRLGTTLLQRLSLIYIDRYASDITCTILRDVGLDAPTTARCVIYTGSYSCILDTTRAAPTIESSRYENCVQPPRRQGPPLRRGCAMSSPPHASGDAALEGG